MFRARIIFVASLVLLRIWESWSGHPGNVPNLMKVPKLVYVFLLTAILHGQVSMHASEPGDMVQLLPADSSVLELREPRSDLPCTVKPVKPHLGFDLKFHSGYQVNIPLRELDGRGDALTMIFRVTTESQEIQPVYLRQKAAIPPLEENARGDVFLEGSFDLGEGKYLVDWLVRDRAGRFCSAYWEVSLSLPSKDKGMFIDIPPGVVRPSEDDPFEDEPPAQTGRRHGPVRAKILVNFAPQNGNRTALQPDDINGLLSILHSIAREPRIGTFSLVAFNVEQQQVIFREENAERIGFRALGQALKSLNLGTIDVKRLSRRNSDAEFLADLAAEEAKEASADMVIFVGPKVISDSGIHRDSLRQLGQVDFPVFYLNYNLDPQSIPWRDAIGSVVKQWKGLEFTITRPHDLLHSWSEIMYQVGHRTRERNGRNYSSRREMSESR
jgi:hypothetical protein